jgi:ribosome-associated protein
MNETTPENDTLEISKSQLKRDAHELLALARQLISMPQARLDNLPLDEELRKEVDFARSIRSHGAKKRQLMTVGKMLRKRDNQALLDAVNKADQVSRQQQARFHMIEAWRDRLVEGSDNELSELLEKTAGANAQMLRQLIRNARKEARLQKPPSSSRKLFRLLREMDSETPLPPL